MDTPEQAPVNDRKLSAQETVIDIPDVSSADGPEPPQTQPAVSNGKHCQSCKGRRVNKFYKRQNNLLGKYEDDTRMSEKLKKLSLTNNMVRIEVVDEEEEREDQALLRGTGDGVPGVTAGGSSHQPTSPQITVIERTHSDTDSDDVPEDNSVRRLALITLIVNVVLVFSKAIAAYLSGSLSIFSSFIESMVDITSGLVIWKTERAVRRRDPYDYPRGRTRLEPLALVIVSVIMAVASVQILIRAVTSIVDQSVDPTVDWPTIVIMMLTVVVKLGLFIACKYQPSNQSIDVLAQDHRNDCLSNAAVLLCAFAAQHLWVYLDPIGAILVSIYIAATWYFTGKDQLNMLSGRSAKPDFINRIIKLCIDHDSEIQFIDTVYVYHFGHRFLVEVHLVLDGEMPLRLTHDISETLQTKLEALPEVERAFVHSDYNFDHNPNTEHKIV